jgi:hypothetical protein
MRKGHYVIAPILPELRYGESTDPVLGRPYTSETDVIDVAGVKSILVAKKLRIEDTMNLDGEFLR